MTGGGGFVAAAPVTNNSIGDSIILFTFAGAIVCSVDAVT